jgi:hypothetical protein
VLKVESDDEFFLENRGSEQQCSWSVKVDCDISFQLLLSRVYDDVEDFYYNTVQSSLSNWFIDNNAGVTVGIILLQALSRLKIQLL